MVLGWFLNGFEPVQQGFGLDQLWLNGSIFWNRSATVPNLLRTIMGWVGAVQAGSGAVVGQSSPFNIFNCKYPHASVLAIRWVSFWLELAATFGLQCSPVWVTLVDLHHLRYGVCSDLLIAFVIKYLTGSIFLASVLERCHHWSLALTNEIYAHKVRILSDLGSIELFHCMTLSCMVA